MDAPKDTRADGVMTTPLSKPAGHTPTVKQVLGDGAGEAERAFAGLLFDFGGFLTSGETRYKFSSYDEAGPMVQAIQEFAKTRGLRLDEANVRDWRAQLAPTTNGWVMVPVEPTPEMLEAAMQVKRERLKHALTEMRAGKDEFEARSPVVKGEWLAMLAAAPVFQPQHGEEA